MNKFKAYILAGLASTILAVATPAMSATTSTSIKVGAVIAPYVSLEAKQAVVTYNVTAEDLKRGYVDLPNSVTVNFRSNLTGEVPVAIKSADQGSILVSEQGAGQFSGTALKLKNSTLGERVTRNLDARIILASNAQVGTYPLNLTISPAI